MINLSSDAVVVKIRAKYSDRLNHDDFENLVSCKSISDIAIVLKNKKNYESFLGKVNEKDICRTLLESILLNAFFEDLSILARYDSVFGKKIFKYILTKFEISQIRRFLVFLKSGNAKKFECVVPYFFRSESKIKFEEFNKAEGYSSFLESFSRTDYYKILVLDDLSKERFDINKVDARLYSYLFNVFYTHIKQLDRKSKKESLRILYDYVDLSNIIRIVRSKRFYNLSDEYISDIIFKFGDYKFSKYDILSDSNFSDFGFIDENIKSIRDLEKFSKIAQFKWAKRNIRFSNISEIVGFSYVFLKEIEMRNLINIIEGVRYKISEDNIRAMIVK